jgi:hypothetical protein
MRTALVALRMGFGLALVGPAPLAGQQAVSVAIEGFNGFPWGVSRTEIEAAFGEPDQADRMDNGVLVLAFRDSLLSREAVTLYALLEGRGLVKGQHMVRIDLEAGDCEGQYRVYRDYVTLRYPLIKPVESYEFPFSVDFCTAIADRTGGWATQWKDPSTGAVVTVVVEEGTEVVKLIYESGAFLEWLDPPPSAEEDSD